MTNGETSELQAVDFALGAFIARAFDGYAAKGPKEWQNFLVRPVNRKIFRHDGDTPGEVVKAALKAQSTVTAPNQKPVNAIELPLAYYARKPGIANTIDQKGMRGRFACNDELTNIYNLKMLPCQLDYKLGFAAWDKPSLDKLVLAWYAFVAFNDAFTVPYMIGEDVFEIRAVVDNNTTVTITDESKPRAEGRLYAASTQLTINTNVIFGELVSPAAPITVIFNLTEFLL